MTTNRLEAFSDGVIAILITVMVLEFKTPHTANLAELRSIAPTLFCYVLSFIFLGIYWNNHHHMLHSVKHLNGAVLWANHHLLFWLSLIPFATAWLGEGHFASGPVLVYGSILLMCGVAYTILARSLIKVNGPNSEVAKRLGRDFKGWASVSLYSLAIALSMFVPMVSCAIYVFVALMWLVPDRRFEHGGAAPEE